MGFVALVEGDCVPIVCRHLLSRYQQAMLDDLFNVRPPWPNFASPVGIELAAVTFFNSTQYGVAAFATGVEDTVSVALGFVAVPVLVCEQPIMKAAVMSNMTMSLCGFT